MRTNCRITIISDIIPELETLVALGAKKVEMDLPPREDILSFYDIDDSMSHFDEILALVEQIKEKARYAKTQFSRIFSEEECLHAEYLHVRSTYAGIDTFSSHPELYALLHYYDTVAIRGKIAIDLFEHVRQVDSALAIRTPAWKTSRQFCSDYGSAMQNLYCSDLAKKVILDSGLSGAEFRPVLSEKTREPLPDLWQLWAKECADFLAPGPFMQTRVCKECGRTRYFSSGGRAQLEIREELVPQGLDFMQVSGAVGADFGYPYIVISQKAYRSLKQSAIVRALVFEPLSFASTRS